MEEKAIFPRKDGKDKLNKKLALLEDLWQKLVHVKWSQESFAVLGQLTRDVVQTARKLDCQLVADLALQLEHQVNDAIAIGQIPAGLARDRLEALLSELRRVVAPTAATETVSGQDEGSLAPVTQAPEIMLIAADEDAPQLVLKLGDAGFRVRHLDNLAEAQKALIETRPKALIVDVDFPERPRAGIGMIAQLRTSFRLMAPVFFLARHGDLVTRLEAVRMGGSAYFTKPVDIFGLLGKLNDPILQGSAQGCRILILDDILADAQRLAQTLEAKGMVTQIITQPLQVMLALHRFQPDLLLLSLDLEEVGGKELAKVIRQYEPYGDLPMILLSTVTDPSRRLTALEVGADDLLGKPVAEDYLLAAVTYRLRRARSQHARLATLSHKDIVSGLYNRQHLLAQLERTVASLGINTRGVALMLILLDNLRAVREASDVATADEVLEQAARRLQVALAPRYQAARFGDAVFAVLIKDAHEEALLAIARRVCKSLEGEIYEINKQRLQLRACIGIGIVTAASGERDYRSLVQQADLACSVARDAQGERIHIHNPHVDQENQEYHRQRLLEEIHEAVERERMGLVFQPIVSLRGDQFERYEVLLRMLNREGQELLPETVFAAVQQHRLGVALDRWVIAQSIRLLQERKAHGRATTLFINISPATLRDDALPPWLQKRLEQTQVLAKDMVFEVAETTAGQYLKELQQFLDGIKALGCGFSVERFGGQTDPMGLLRDLPVNYVKLDGGLIRGLANNKTRQQQLKDLVKGLESQGVTVIAGGIEDLHALPLLWSCGINYVQGFFLQRPHQEMSYDFTGGVI